MPVLQAPLLQVVDDLLPGRALVFGTPPPAGRDLDLLVRPDEEEALSAGLAGHGFLRRGHRWARFDGCHAEVVEVFPAAGWALPAEELSALFSDGTPLEGTPHLVRPAPAHTLLILARRLVRGDGRLDPKRRAHVERALQHPGAWDEAARRAPAWGAVSALALLRQAVEDDRRAGPLARARALTEGHLAAGRSALGAALRAGRSLLHRPPHGRVIAISGIDGSGKTSQAEALRAALEALGYEAVTAWTRITLNPSVEKVGTAAKRLLRPLVASRAGAAGGGTATVTADEAGTSEEIGRLVRRRSPLLNHAWITYVALLNARSQRQATRRHLRRGRMVICDRYTLDSAVHLRYKYGSDTRLGFETGLIRLLSPTPAAAFLLDVDAGVALARKADEFGLTDLHRFAELYRREYGAHGVVRLDGAQPAEALCTSIARRVWEILE